MDDKRRVAVIEDFSSRTLSYFYYEDGDAIESRLFGGPYDGTVPMHPDAVMQTWMTERKSRSGE